MRLAASSLAMLLQLALAPRVLGAEAPAARGEQPAVALDAAPAADAILGDWWSEGKEGRLRIVKTKSGLFEVIFVDGKDAEKKDVNNPDPKLRDRKLRGLVIMWRLRFEDGEYVGGYCYNPRDGNTYRVKMKITGPRSLRLRGYLGISLLGQNQDWTRAD